MRTLLMIVALVLALVPTFVDAKRPTNRIPVSPTHYPHDLHQFSPFFDIDLDCKTIQWNIEESGQQKATFDIRDRRAMRIDPTILASLSNGSVTPKPEATETLYVSNVRKTKEGFTVNITCVP